MQLSRKDVASFIESHYRRKDISMLALTPDFIKDFAAYLSTDRGLANGTIWQRCMWLKGVVLRAHYDGKIPRNPFAQFHMTTDNIVDINGDKWIISKCHKTMVSTNRPGIPFQVKLMDVPLQIIDRYKHLQEDKLVFGKINYWSMCKKLKKVMEACGIEKSISFHCGRYSFATLTLSKGMPIESVSRVLGHTNIVTIQI